MAVTTTLKAKIRGVDGGALGRPLSVTLTVNERREVVQLQQPSTLTNEPDEVPRDLIILLTDRGGYWHDSDDQSYWESWVMYPEISDADHTAAHASLQRMLQRWVRADWTGPLSDSTRIKLVVLPKQKGGELESVMELEVTKIISITIPPLRP